MTDQPEKNRIDFSPEELSEIVRAIDSHAAHALTSLALAGTPTDRLRGQFDLLRGKLLALLEMSRYHRQVYKAGTIEEAMGFIRGWLANNTWLIESSAALRQVGGHWEAEVWGREPENA